MKQKMAFAGKETLTPHGSQGLDVGAGTGAQNPAVPASFTGNHGKATSFARTPGGVESATARRVLSRLQAFADISPTPPEQPSMSAPAPAEGFTQSEHRMVEKDIFGYIARVSGLSLTEEELSVLADATDPHPLAQRVRCDGVVEVLAAVPGKGGDGGRDRQRDPYAALYDEEEEEDEGEKEEGDDGPDEDGYYYDERDDAPGGGGSRRARGKKAKAAKGPALQRQALDYEALPEAAQFALKHIAHQVPEPFSLPPSLCCPGQ
jgi:hypothetical protein